MSVEYRAKHLSTKKDGFSQIMNETAEYFAQNRFHIIGQGFDEILTEQGLFDTYVSKLCADMSADEAEQMTQLLENARMQILGESSISGIQPYASLSMPTIRKMWPKVALKNSIPTEAVKAPKFVISYMQPYLINPDGTKVMLPSGLRDANNTNAEKTPLQKAPISLPANVNLLTMTAQATVDATGAGIGPAIALSTAPAGQPLGAYSVTTGDSIDPVFYVEYVHITNNSAVSEYIMTHFPLDVRGNATGVVTASDGVTDTIFFTLDRSTGVFVCLSFSGKVTAVQLKGWVSSETNKQAVSVTFDILTKDVTIGTGTHINAPLSIEWLQDTMAMYQIDGALEVVDLMSSTVAQKLDLEILNFLIDSYVRNQNSFTSVPYAASFDSRPSAAFAGTPKDWREELKTIFDYIAIKMKIDSCFTNGTYNLIGNPLDMNLITNVDWSFSSVSEERNGVEVDYNVGAYSGSQRYQLVSSINVPQGVIRMIFIPGTQKQMTYKYYPYTFNVEKGYIDPNRPYVPSIMMTKRQAIEELTPIQAEITILHNDTSMLNSLDRSWSTTVNVNPAP